MVFKLDFAAGYDQYIIAAITTVQTTLSARPQRIIVAYGNCDGASA